MGALVVLGVGVGVWRAIASDSSLSVDPEEIPADERPVAGPAMGEAPPSRHLPELAPRPREGIFDPREEFPSVGEEFGHLRLFIPSMAKTFTVRGSLVREAVLALPGVYLRWDSEEVKEAFLRAELRLRPDVGMDATEFRTAGAPLLPAFELLPSVGFRAHVRPPLIRIAAHRVPEGDPATPR